MLYWIIRPLAKLALLIYFRKIWISGIENIPGNRPVILAANHPSAFMEACLLACLLPYGLYFLVRGDVFISRFVHRILRQLHQTPIYRFRDGFGKMRENAEAFRQSYEWLRQKKILVVFVEANTKLEVRLRPAQKGFARITYGALSQGIDDVAVVPVGVNYESPEKPRTRVNIVIGEPLSIDSIRNLDERGWIDRQTRAMDTSLQKLVVHLSDTHDTSLFRKLENFLLPAPSGPPVERNNLDRFQSEKAIASAINGLNKEAKELIDKKLKTVEDLGWRSAEPKRKRKAGKIEMRLMTLISRLCAIVLLFHWPPYRFAKWMAARYVRGIEFYGPIFVGTVMLAAPLYYMVIILMSWVFAQSLFIAPLILVLLGYPALLLREYFAVLREIRRFQLLSRESLGKISEIRQEILDHLQLKF